MSAAGRLRSRCLQKRAPHKEKAQQVFFVWGFFVSNTLKKLNRTTVECLQVDGEADDVQVVNSGHRQAQESSALELLVWKYFEEDIRATLLEVQEAIQPQESQSNSQVSHRKVK